MKIKSIITIALLSFVAVSLGYLVLKEVRQRSQMGSKAENRVSCANANVDEGKDRVLAYYFHGTSRCQTCRKIEAYAREALEKGFSDALKTGRLQWHALNVEEPQNEHFIRDYNLSTRSLVLVEIQDGKEKRWKNLGYVWELVGSKDKFFDYVQREARAYIGDKN